jgi:hypothetical protein
MAKCKSCKTNIPEGTEYCKDCNDKVGVKSNESYLDSLLSSVKNNPSVENIYKKKNNKDENGDNPDKDMNRVQKNDREQVAKPRQRKAPVRIPETEEDDLYRVDLSDIEDFGSFNFEDDLGDIDRDIIISDEELFGESLSSILETEDSPEEDLNSQIELGKIVGDVYSDENQSEKYIERESLDQNGIEEILHLTNEDPEEDNHSTKEEKLTYEEEKFPVEAAEFNTEVENNWTDAIATETVLTETEDSITDLLSNVSEMPDDEYSELSEDTDLDLDLDELLNSIDTQSLEATVAENMANPDEDMFTLYGMDEVEENLSSGNTDFDNNSSFEPIDADQDNFLSLLGQVSDEDSSAEDIRAISDMLAGNSALSRENNMPSNVGEVFSDALKAVSSLNDYELEEEAILERANAKNTNNGNKGKNDNKDKASKKKAKEKSGISLFQRLFGNIKNNNTAAEFEEEKRKLTEPKAEKTKKAKGKAKKDTTAVGDEDEEVSRGQQGGKDKVTKKASKKDKAEKKKKSKEIIAVIDEIDEDPGRINRVGALIVFFFFGIIAVILILGTNMVTYTLSIQHATKYFDHRKYTQAYNEVYGVDIKDEDIGLYDKIQTVMFVNKQLNSYNNYYDLEQYPAALDSLLKGLSRYDKYIELATMLGIESDLDYVRSQILAELSNVFNLTEEEAIQILSFDNMEDYSLAVYDVVLEKMNN